MIENASLPLGLIDSISFDGEQKTHFVDRDSWVFLLAVISTTLYPSSYESLERWSRYVPQNTTTIVDPIERLSVGATFSTTERIQDIIRFLGLTKTQLKDICKVSRQTLYDWLDAKFEPDKENAERLRATHELALLVPQHSQLPIRASVLKQPIAGNDSFLDMLQRPQLDMPLLRKAIVILAQHSSKQEQRSARAMCERLGFKAIKDVSQETNLNENLKDLGTI